MIGLLREKGYSFADYLNYSNFNKAVILRHDVDFSLEKALEMAEIEKKEEVQSTYFILLSTNFYNIFSKESCDIIKKIQSLGHNIGLHFDEKKYDITDKESMEFYITKEKKSSKKYWIWRLKLFLCTDPQNGCWKVTCNLKKY